MAVYKKTMTGGVRVVVTSGHAPSGFTEISQQELVEDRLARRMERRRAQAAASNDTRAASSYLAVKNFLTS